MSDLEELKRRKEELKLRRDIAALERSEQIFQKGPKWLLIAALALVGSLLITVGFFGLFQVGSPWAALFVLGGGYLLLKAYRRL